jgi:6-phosphofructokinase 1
MKKRVAVLTSGGDAPGMNAAIRAVVRFGIAQNCDMFGVKRGFAGLIDGSIIPLTARDVGGIIQTGGTFLGSARCQEFTTVDGRFRAISQLTVHKIDALIVIGGNGSQQGAHSLWKMNIPVVGIASTIDNDLYGSDISIGVDTALNIAMEAIDRLKVTASSHQRALLVEVMGRNCGYLALMAGLAGGAEAVVIPEREVEPQTIALEIRDAHDRGKMHALVVVAEGCQNNADKLVEYFKKHREEHGFEFRATILGHVQRGGAPTVFDRVLATRMGAAAMESVANGRFGVLMCLLDSHIRPTPLAEVVSKKKELNLSLLDLAKVLAR